MYEVITLLSPITVEGDRCLYNEHSYNQLILIMQYLEGVGIGGYLGLRCSYFRSKSCPQLALSCQSQLQFLPRVCLSEDCPSNLATLTNWCKQSHV